MTVPFPRTPLALTYDPALVPKDGEEVLRSPGALVKSASKEPAGHLFHKAALLAAGITKLNLDGSEEVEANAKPLRKIEEIDMTRWEGCGTVLRKKSKKHKGGEDELDKYALLGLHEERYLATEKSIKDAYRDACLLFHPDKCGAAMMDEDDKTKTEERFKCIQEAYDCLSAPEKRRVYDSTDDFNDHLPSSADTPADYYKNFGAAFLRQSRWSLRQPIPQLGDENTPIEQVSKFYDFWFGYKSWREFPDEEENDLESAECREHKRWMERQNSKMREKNKKKEDKRMMNYVETAYKQDPRIVAMKQKDKEEKDAKKKAKNDEKNKEKNAKEETARLEAERLEAEKLSSKANKDQAKKEAEKQKKALQKERKRLRQTMSDLREKLGAMALLPSVDQTDAMCSSLTIEEIKDVCDNKVTPELTADAAVELFNSILSRIGEGEVKAVASDDAASAPSPAPSSAVSEVKKAPTPAPPKAKSAPEAPKENVGADWSEEELRMLTKGMKKFPKGVVRRWEQISGYLGSRTADEVIAVSKARFTVDGALAKPGDAYEKFVKDKEANASNKQKDSVASDRQTSFSDVEVNLTGAAAAETNTNGGGAAVEGGDAKSEEEWTLVQEQALVKAVKTFPKGCAANEKERWGLIGKAVPAKNASQCVKHMPVMLARMRASKAAA